MKKGLKKLSSMVFHKVFDWLSGRKSDKSIANFGIYHGNVIAEYNRMPELARSFGALIGYLGFAKTKIDASLPCKEILQRAVNRCDLGST